MVTQKQIVRRIIEVAYKSQCGHIGSALSIVPLLERYYKHSKREGDILILSKGHGVLALYAFMEAYGELENWHLDRYLDNGTELFGLADPRVRGISTATGSLGHGICIAAGLALAFKKQKKLNKVYCIVGDGEAQEGSYHEAIHFSVAQELHTNLEIWIDNNGFQAMGKTDDISKYYQENPFVFSFKTKKGNGISFMENNNEWHYRRLDEFNYKRALLEC